MQLNKQKIFNYISAIIRVLLCSIAGCILLGIIVCVVFSDVFIPKLNPGNNVFTSSYSRAFKEYSFEVEKALLMDVPDEIDQQLIHVHTSARTERKLRNIDGIVIHYVANPKTTAQQNRNFFDNPETEVSSHFIVGLDGEIIQCVPLYERSCASNTRNGDTIAIEVCHPDKTGKFNDETYKSLIKLISWLCDEFGLTEDQIIRHHDITGKICPKYYVDHEDEWIKLKEDVKEVRQNTK